MRFSAGDKLGPYEILGPIGAGGMGEVYRARDPRLGRQVAVKVSLDRFSDRFEREARAVAALNHPNICHLYDVGPDYLVMELVEGESPKGPLPLDRALDYMRQTASALDAAHEKGIVHRDLKPANIKISPEGKVTVLDFGLAKVFQRDDNPSNSEDSPTFTMEATQAGVILGTAAYMSPEQARGKGVDKRSDIWAFGVVFYELLIGSPPFQGEDLTEVLASIVKDSPDLHKAPSEVRRLLAKCLEKDPKKRLRDIGDVWELLEVPSKRRTAWPWVASLVALAVVALAGWLRPGSDAGGALPVTLSIVPPPGVTLSDFGSNSAGPEIAPDGSAVLFKATGGFYVRRLDSLESMLVPGSEAGANPGFWSPDSTAVVFPDRAARQLKKVRMPDGGPQVIAPLSGPSRSGSWSESGTILFSSQSITSLTLFTVPAAGGEVKPAQVPEPFSRGRMIYPEFLPGREDFLFFFTPSRGPGEGGIYLATLLSGGRIVNPRLLMKNATPASYTQAGGGRIVFAQNDNLYAQRLSLSGGKLEGEAELLVRGVASAERADFSVSQNGTLAWRPGSVAQSVLTEFDREGNPIGTSGPKGPQSELNLSPDGTRFLINRDLAYLVDIGQTGRVELPRDVTWLGWRADGSRLIGVRDQTFVEISASGSGDVHELRRLPWNHIHFVHLSPRGDLIIADDKGELLAIPVDGTRKEETPRLITKNAAEIFSPVLSPDGRWILYMGPDGGLYVQPYPEPGPRRQIAQAGTRPVWRGDGKEILYLSGATVMSVSVAGSERLTFAAPRKLFSGLRMPGGAVDSSVPLAVARDGSRIFWLQEVEHPDANLIHVRIGAVK